MNKKRILVSAEYSAIGSGFGVYTKNLCNELLDAGYDVAEHASSCQVNDARDKDIKWKLYANHVSDDHPDAHILKSNKLNNFGAWRFNEILLDFMPDVVIDFRDFSMMNHVHGSPLRSYFQFLSSACIDSHPLIDEWKDMALQADGFLSYSDYGREVIEKECGGRVNFLGVAYPGTDENIKPLDKSKIRKELDIPQDWLIVGTVMRNQRRKLFLDIIDAFKIYLNKTKEKHPNLYKNTYIYFHTSVIDLNPFNIIKYLKANGLADKVLFTYKCHQCGCVFPDFFKGMRNICRNCRKNSASTPHVGFTTTRKELNNIYNLFDVYLQYSVAEASGFGIQEAGASGTYVMGTDCTAMSNSLRMLNGDPIKVGRIFHDIDVQSIRYMPDNQDLVNKLILFLSLPKQIRLKKGYEAHLLAKEKFNWKKNAKVWIDAIESLPDNKLGWDAPFPNIKINFNVPDDLSNEQFVNWCVDNIMLDSDFKNTFIYLNSIRNLNNGYINDNGKVKPYTKDNFFKFCKSKIEARIHYEKIRCGMLILPEKDYIKYARVKNMLND